jgi:hypothetical protein
LATTEAERRIKILEYLRGQDKGKKVNKSDVMRYLESISRLKTTHGTIQKLIKEKKIVVIKDNPKSQTQYLTINEENEFNKIYNSLSEIENIVNSIDHFVRARHELMRQDKDSKAANLLDVYLLNTFEQPLDSMLNILIIKITYYSSQNHLFPEDSQILYKKITKLIQKRALQWGSHRTIEDKTKWILDYFIAAIDNIGKRKEKDFQKYAGIYKKYDLDFGIKDDLIDLMKNFQGRFLT